MDTSTFQEDSGLEFIPYREYTETMDIRAEDEAWQRELEDVEWRREMGTPRDTG